MTRRPAAPLVATAAALLLLASAAPALAQSCGGCAGPAVTGSPGADRAWLAPGEVSVRLADEYEVKDRSYRGRDRVENDFSEDLYVNRASATLRIGFARDWAAELGLTHVHFSYNLTPPGGRRTKRVFSGLGDTTLLVGRRIALADEAADALPFRETAYTVLDADRDAARDDAPRRRVASLSIWAGASLPTGRAERPDPRLVTRDVSVTNLQTGTGTFDPALRARLDLPGERVDWFVEAGARVPLRENRHDYRTGETLALSAGAALPLGDAWAVGLAATYQKVGRDSFRGDDVAVGGGRFLYVTPALAWRLDEAVALDVGVRVTLWRDVDTKLSDSAYALTAGLTFRF
mgnify:CR=1 FL=1